MSIELTPSDLENILEFSKEIAREAGKLIIQGSQAIQAQRGSSENTSTSGEGVSEKKNAVDLVTEWDVKVEEYVKSEIRKRYPSFSFIGEESYSAGNDTRTITNDTPAFCVDPIDGTTNFIHGFPFACISIGFIYKTQPTIGVIFNPFLNHMYSALKSKGAYLNETRLPVHPPAPLPSLASALIAVEWGSDRSLSIITKKADSFTKLAGDGRPGEVAGGRMAHSLRSLGSAALNYGMVASGSLDLYWEIGCWPWDVCAGIVIAQEAGGMVVGSRDHRDHDENVSEEFLWGRKYLVVRAMPDTTAESGREAQKRIVNEFYETVEDWSPV